MLVLARLVLFIFLNCIVFIGFYSQASGEVLFYVKAKSAALFDFNTEQFLLEQNAEEKIEPASFTKLMTLYLVQDALKDGIIALDDQVPVSRKAWGTEGSRMFIEAGKKVLLEDLLKGIAVASGNDACVAVAEYIAGKEEVFVDEMNRKVRDLGLKNTVFKNSHGLPAEGQYTTAHDMALLAYHYIKDYPQVISLHSITEFTYNNITQSNRNRLLRMDVGVDGLKTGHVKSAGYHLIATAKREGRRLIAVVMGAKSWEDRENEALRLLNYGFRNFVIKKVLKKGEVIKSVPVKEGKYDTVDLIAQEGVTLSVPRRDKDSLKLIEVISSQIIAPVSKGEVLGKVVVKIGDKTIREVNLLAKDSVPKGWQAYWKLGLTVLAILLLAFIIRWIIRKRRSSRRYTFQENE